MIKFGTVAAPVAATPPAKPAPAPVELQEKPTPAPAKAPAAPKGAKRKPAKEAPGTLI